MKLCDRCGESNSDRARFCQACGARLAEGVEPRDSRRTVSVVFADIKGSTQLAQRLDPESFKDLITRYFEAMRAIVERHGGTVEKFIGDALMAVFGIPTLHEDDAPRSVRAAMEMHEALDSLNRGLEERWKVRMAIRVGVATGEVITSANALNPGLVTGGAVNLAARLEEAARPGEVWVSRDTVRLIRDEFEVEDLVPLDLKGFAEPVEAYRVVGRFEKDDGSRQIVDAPLVGRRRELAVIREAFDKSVARRECVLHSVLGHVGVGKSRLANEFLAGVREEATVLWGRCPSYGEGNTFRPLVDVVKQAACIEEHDSAAEARSRITALLSGEDNAGRIAEDLAQMIGLTETTVPARESFWAVRDLLESMARRRPLVVLFDDVHWAEPTFLELLRFVVESSREAPVLILCVARTEIVDSHPEWTGEGAVGGSLVLAPLTDIESRSFLEIVLGNEALDLQAEKMILEAAQGNPLFLQETVSMFVDEGLLVSEGDRFILKGHVADLRVPPTIQALLAARLDRLPLPERLVLETAAVVGEVFGASEVKGLLPGDARGAFPEHLGTLVRREFVRRDDSVRPSAGGRYRFHHTLVRDVAYEAIPKERRARIHADLAAQLEREALGWSRWYQELVGYHFERAFLYRQELGATGETDRALARRAAEQLASAARKAHVRRDMPAVVDLLTRATRLYGDEPARLELLPLLGDALAEIGEFDRAHEVVAEAIEGSRKNGLRGIESHALIVLLKLPRKSGFSVSLGYGIGGEPVIRRRD